MKLKVYNSLSNELQDFTAIDDSNVRMYACGPTVYASPHIGNARPIVVFDVLFRLLKVIYNEKVTYVRNITDVDDKINNKAKELGISIRELTDNTIKEFHSNIDLLNVLRPTHEPRATDHINEMLSIIDLLIQNNYAYEAQGHVLFRVRKMSSYGSLSKRDIDDMIAGSRVEIAPYKEDPMDFVLWKPSNTSETSSCSSETSCTGYLAPFWDSKYGKGRPGWHLECSAMSHKYLGERFDLHVGGQDLMFPHHENEIAQNYGAFGCMMCNYWMHNGMLLVDGQKMSKSLGNVVSLDDVLSKYDGEVLRYVLLSTHYQKTLNWTEELIIQSKQALNRLYGALALHNGNSSSTQNSFSHQSNSSVVIHALCNNLNTPQALSELHKIADRIYKSTDKAEIQDLCELLKREASVLGLLERKHWFTGEINDGRTDAPIRAISEEQILELINQRAMAKREKNYQLADSIREQLLSFNVQIEDSKDSTTWKFI